MSTSPPLVQFLLDYPWILVLIGGGSILALVVRLLRHVQTWLGFFTTMGQIVYFVDGWGWVALVVGVGMLGWYATLEIVFIHDQSLLFGGGTGASTVSYLLDGALYLLSGVFGSTLVYWGLLRGATELQLRILLRESEGERRQEWEGGPTDGAGTEDNLHDTSDLVQNVCGCLGALVSIWSMSRALFWLVVGGLLLAVLLSAPLLSSRMEDLKTRRSLSSVFFRTVRDLWSELAKWFLRVCPLGPFLLMAWEELASLQWLAVCAFLKEHLLKMGVVYLSFLLLACALDTHLLAVGGSLVLLFGLKDQVTKTVDGLAEAVGYFYNEGSKLVMHLERLPLEELRAQKRTQGRRGGTQRATPHGPLTVGVQLSWQSKDQTLSLDPHVLALGNPVVYLCGQQKGRAGFRTVLQAGVQDQLCWGTIPVGDLYTPAFVAFGLPKIYRPHGAAPSMTLARYLNSVVDIALPRRLQGYTQGSPVARLLWPKESDVPRWSDQIIWEVLQDGWERRHLFTTETFWRHLRCWLSPRLAEQFEQQVRFVKERLGTWRGEALQTVGLNLSRYQGTRKRKEGKKTLLKEVAKGEQTLLEDRLLLGGWGIYQNLLLQIAQVVFEAKVMGSPLLYLHIPFGHTQLDESQRRALIKLLEDLRTIDGVKRIVIVEVEGMLPPDVPGTILFAGQDGHLRWLPSVQRAQADAGFQHWQAATCHSCVAR